MPEKPDLRVDWCSYEAAKYAIMHWHYSKAMPKSKQVFAGVWEAGEFIGAVIFGRSTTPWLGDAYGLRPDQCAELTRVALAEHSTQVSRILAIACRKVSAKDSGLRLLVSFADSNQGHIGAIYQAANWVYVGTAGETKQYLWRGKWRNDTPMFREFQQKNVDRASVPQRKIAPKHKYLYPLDHAMRAQIEPLRKPYPKRPPDRGTAANGGRQCEPDPDAPLSTPAPEGA